MTADEQAFLAKKKEKAAARRQRPAAPSGPQAGGSSKTMNCRSEYFWK